MRKGDTVKVQGYRVAQIDVADHIGEERSTWGNGTYSSGIGKELDRVAWGMA